MKRRGLITFIILAILVFAGLTIYGDAPDLFGQISSFPISYWFMVLALALGNYLLRLARWHYYLRILGIKIGVGASVAIFMSGLSMAVSPGRVGELAKSYYLKEKQGVPVALSSSAVIAERLTDLLAVLLLSLWGLTFIPNGWVVATVLMVALGLFVLLVVSPWGSEKVLSLPMPRRWRPFLGTARDAFRQVLSLKPLAIALVLGVSAWFAEGAALWLVLRGLDASASLSQAVSIYAVATLLGAITMLPGGLVATEGGMVALLQQIDLTKTTASSATLVIRLCTLWFAVVIGLLALAYVHFNMPRRDTSEVESVTFHPDTPGQTT